MNKIRKCPECGYEMPVVAAQCPRCGAAAIPNQKDTKTPGFFEYYLDKVWNPKSEKGSLFPRFDFSAPMPMKRFWISILLINLIYGGLLTILVSIFSIYNTVSKIIIVVFGLLYLVKIIELQVRRLRDIHKSSWLVVLSFVPLLNLFPIILYFFQGSECAKTKHGLADYISWVVVVAIFILGLIFLPSKDITAIDNGKMMEQITPDDTSIEDREPLNSTTGEVVTFYDSEYLRDVSESERWDGQLSSDGKYEFFIREDLLDDGEFYASYSWLCVRSTDDENIEIPLLLVEDGEGMHFLDGAVSDSGQIILHIGEGQDLMMKKEIIYDFPSHQILSVEEMGYIE